LGDIGSYQEISEDIGILFFNFIFRFNPISPKKQW